MHPMFRAKRRLCVLPVRGVRPRHAGAALRRPWPGALSAMAPAPPVRHRRRPAGAARRPRLRPAARRQVGVAARVAVAQRAVAPTGSWPGGRLWHGGLPRQRVNGVRGGGGGGLGCDRGHLRSCMPEVSVDILTQVPPPAPAKLPLGRAATPRQRFGNRLAAASQEESFNADSSRCTPMHADNARPDELSGGIFSRALTGLKAASLDSADRRSQRGRRLRPYERCALRHLSAGMMRGSVGCPPLAFRPRDARRRCPKPGGDGRALQARCWASLNVGKGWRARAVQRSPLKLHIDRTSGPTTRALKSSIPFGVCLITGPGYRELICVHLRPSAAKNLASWRRFRRAVGLRGRRGGLSRSEENLAADERG